MTGRILCVGRRCNTVGEAVETRTPTNRFYDFDSDRYITTGGEVTTRILWTFVGGNTESEEWPSGRTYLPTMCPRCYKPTRG
jgi:hypothetical protein